LLIALATAWQPVGAADTPEPTINDVNPNNGPTKGGTIVTIGGTNFGTGDTSVQPMVSVGGAPCQQVVWVSSTSILCETPDGVGGHKSVVVSVDGVNSSPDRDAIFNYDPPTVQAIEPGHGAASGGTMVTIIGDNFGATNNNPSVTIGGRPCQSVVWLANTKLKCVSPAGIGIGDVRVFILDESSPENFGTIFEFDAPLVTRLEPDHGPGTGGYTVTVHGTNFGTVDSKPQIKVNGKNCQTTEWKSNTEVLCVAPSGQGTGKDVSVDILGQPSKTSPGTRFSYDGPIVTGMDPANGPTIGGTELTVYGSNFGSREDGKKIEVRIGEVPCSSQTWVSQSTVICVTPSGTGAAREVQVQVTGLNSESCTEKAVRHKLCPGMYQYDGPIIQAVEPAFGPTTGGFFVNVPGDNYGTGPSALKILVGKEECEKTNWVSNTMAQCLVPAGVGIRNVIVQVDGQRSSQKTQTVANADTFTYEAPVIERVLPSTGSPAGGQLVTIEGRNFGTDKSEVEVLVGDLPGKVVKVSQQRVLMVMPQGEGQHAIKLRVAQLESHDETPGAQRHGVGAKEMASSGAGAKGMVPLDDFKYKGPRVTAVVPAHGVTQGGNLITLFGKDLGGPGTPVKVTIGGFACIESRWISDSSSTCSTPPGAGGGKDVTIVVDSRYRAAAPPGYHFSYSAPYVRSVSPDTGSLDGGSRIVVQGLNFGLTDSHPVAYVGPTRCSTTEWTDDAAVTCVTPAWGTGPTVNPVTVRVNGQTSAENVASAFQYGSRGSPVITALAWSRAPTEGGFTITLFGSKFEDDHAVAYVGRYVTPAQVAITVADAQDNGNERGGPALAPTARPAPMGRCRSTSWVSESKVLCTAPAGVGTHLPVAIRTQDFPEAVTFGSLVFEYDPPVVTAISKSHGSIAGGLGITVTGYGFGMADTIVGVKVGESRCEQDSWISDSSLLCTTPAGQGNAKVEVKVGGQWSSKPGGQHTSFEYEGSSITAISPAFAPASGGAVITLYGHDFADVRHESAPLEVLIITPANRMASVGGYLPVGGSRQNEEKKKCETVEWISATAISCTVPSGVGGSLDVEVLLGQPKELYRGFGLFSYAVPTVASVTPSAGNSAGGLPVTVVGANFGTNDFEAKVYLGATPCARTLYMTDSKLVCVTPAGGGAAVSASVEVSNQHGPLLPSAFGYASPSIFGVHPQSGAIGGDTHLTITGNNFGRSAAAHPKAFVGARACKHTRWVSNKMVVCDTPRGSDVLKANLVTVNVEGIFTPALNSARFVYVQAAGSTRQEGFRSGNGAAPPAGKGTARAPGMYLSIAYLVALGIIVATVVILRMVLFRNTSAQRRSVRKVQRGFFGRASNKLFGWILRSSDDGNAESSVYHVVDSIDIEMEASSEIDMVEHLRPVDH